MSKHAKRIINKTQNQNKISFTIICFITMKIISRLFLWGFVVMPLIFSLLQELNAQPGQGQGRRGGDGSSPPRIGKLEGIIKDSNTREPLMFASVVLNSERDSTMVSGAITNEEGKFVMEELPPGMYYITINFVGYPRQHVNSIRITFREPHVDLVIVEVEPSAQMLGEVTVEAARSLMETGLDRRVINVAQEITAIGGTGLDIMQNIPSVAVDFDGNISLRGSGDVTILIDGRPSTLTGLSGSEALEQIPAEMIERVEVITNPSARYNPEGTSGIINVVLKEQRRPGYNGMVSLNAGTAGRYNGSVNLNYRYNKWNFFTNYSMRYSDMESFGNSLRETGINDPVTPSNFMDQDITGNFGMLSHNIQAGADYHFNSRNILTFSSRYSNWNRNRDDITRYAFYQTIQDPTNLFIMDNETDMLHNAFNHQLNFRRTYEQQHRELNVDMGFSTRTMDRNEDFLQEFFDNNWDTPNGQNVLERSNMDGQNWSFSSQLDYVHPLGDDTKIETGYRVQVRELDSDFTFENFDAQSNNWLHNTNRSNHFIYNEQIYAAYLQYATMIGKPVFKPGCVPNKLLWTVTSEPQAKLLPTTTSACFPRHTYVAILKTTNRYR